MIRKFWAKKLAQKKSVKFMKIVELYQVFMHNFLSQNVPIPTNDTILTSTKTTFYTFHTLSNFISKKIGSIPFFSSSGKDQPRHLVGCCATGISSCLYLF